MLSSCAANPPKMDHAPHISAVNMKRIRYSSHALSGSCAALDSFATLPLPRRVT